MTPNIEKVRILGAALYGKRWMRAVARDLGVSYRTMLRWDAGKFSPGDHVITGLIRIAIERKETIDAALTCSVDE